MNWMTENIQRNVYFRKHKLKYMSLSSDINSLQKQLHFGHLKLMVVNNQDMTTIQDGRIWESILENGHLKRWFTGKIRLRHTHKNFRNITLNCPKTDYIY